MKERNKKKQRVVDKYASLRAEMRSKRDYEGLCKLPRNASPTRVVNRCKITGRRHGYFRKFGVFWRGSCVRRYSINFHIISHKVMEGLVVVRFVLIKQILVLNSVNSIIGPVQRKKKEKNN